MSQHSFHTAHRERPVQVLMGWDRPLSGYFLVVERLDTEDDDERYLYSNLDEEISHPPSVEPFLKVLQELGIKVPPEMIEEVQADGMRNVGNKIVRHVMGASGVYRRDGPLA